MGDRSSVPAPLRSETLRQAGRGGAKSAIWQRGSFVCRQSQELRGLNSHCDAFWDPVSTEIPAHGHSLPFQGGAVCWDQCVDSGSHVSCACLHSSVCVCVCAGSLTPSSP